MTTNKRVIALRLMLEELETPSRDLRISAQCMDCKNEMYAICEWLRKEVEREIEIETLFDGMDLNWTFGDPNPPPA
jgi:hypothetical protein